MGNKTSIHVTRHPSLWEGLGGLLLLLLFAVSCSEADDEEADEYANWQVRNEAYFASLTDSLSQGGVTWQRFRTWSKDQQAEGSSTEYIYVKVLESGTETVSPLYTDTVRVSYRGRLIPSASYAEGYVFDQTYYGTYSLQTTATAKGVVSSFVEGFTTALLHMHPGDRWRIYIPYQLGYGTTASSSSAIPAYSTLIFDLALIDFTSYGEAMAPWSSRQRKRCPEAFEVSDN